MARFSSVDPLRGAVVTFRIPFLFLFLCFTLAVVWPAWKSSTIALPAATLPGDFTESLVASGMPSPTAMAVAPDGRVFVCQQGGSLRVVKNGALLPAPFVTIPVNSSGERGLLGVAFDPNFASNQFVYVYYTTSSAPIHNRVSRFTANGDVAAAGSESILLELNNLTGATNHNGGAMHFGPDGKLYIATGENATPSNSQSLNNLLGKVLRINADGTIPPDNPFFNQTTGDNRAIWALGLRNPFTFNFQPGTGRMFINDVGQTAWEEVNDGIAGSNYGWPTCEGPCNPPNANFRDPIHWYPNNTSTCAITGGAFYNPASPQFPVQYFGKYFFADYCAGWIQLLDPATNGVTGFASGLSFPVDLQVSADGALYYLQRGGGGQLWRVGFSNPQAPATVKSDFDGDGRTDLSIWRGANGNWMVLPSSGGPLQTTPWGASSDSIVPGDFDGDRKTDIAYWQPSDGAWNIIRSSNGQTQSTPWGAGFSPYNDVPVPGDYDGDGRTDLAVWRRANGTWFILQSSTGQFQMTNWGAANAPYNDLPVQADYDGDGKTDIAVWRQSDGNWYVLKSSNGQFQVTGWGLGLAPYNDVAVPVDYDGDGKADIAVWRPLDGNWYILRSSNGQFQVTSWGLGSPYNDVPVPGDYDGDGRADIGVWRQSTGTWFVIRSTNGSFLIQTHGQNGDTPVPSKLQ